MKLKVLIFLLISHLIIGFVGFALGIYALPILTAPTSPQLTQLAPMAQQAKYQAEFIRELTDSDALHWGEGKVSIDDNNVSFIGELAPGPAYQLYFSPTFVETEADFKRLKSSMKSVGNIDTFDNFIVPLNNSVDIDEYTSVVVWCEEFDQFITSAQYRTKD